MTDSPTELQFEPTNCPLCDSEESTLIRVGADLLYHVPGQFPVVQCESCHHVYMNPQPTDDTIGLCYPADYSPHTSGAGSVHRSCNDGTADTAEPADSSDAPTTRTPWYLSGFVRGIPGLRWLYYWLAETKSDYIPEVDTDSPRGLEIGCAIGQFLVRLRSLGWSVQGVEPDDGAAAIARQAGLDVRTGVLDTVELEPGSFDAAFAWMVVEHLKHPQTTLRQIHHLLKPGGVLAISVPNYASLERRMFGHYWYNAELPRHLQHFTPATIRQLLHACGFDDVRIQYQPTLIGVLGSVGLWLRHWSPGSRVANALVRYPDNPRFIWRLLLGIPMRMASGLGWSDRITVVARRTDSGI